MLALVSRYDRLPDMSKPHKLVASSLPKSERTRLLIRDAAAACFRERGYDATTSAEIARRAGVAEGTVFLHHGSKAGLLNAVTIAYYEQIESEAEAIAASVADPATRLHHMIDSWARCLERDWPLIMAFVQQANAAPGSELAATVTARNRAYTRVFVGVIEELKTTGRISTTTPSSFLRDVLFGTLEHAARGQAAKRGAIDVHDAGRQTVDLVLGAAGEATGDRLSEIEAKLDDVLTQVRNAN